MSAFTYTAKRNLAVGHTVDAVYSIDVGLADLQPSRKIERKDHRSISGKQESILRRIDKFSTLKTVPIAENSTLYTHIEEMLDSVAGAELLSFDRWGSVAVPDNAVSVTLELSGLGEARIQGIRHLQYSFKVRFAV